MTEKNFTGIKNRPIIESASLRSFSGKDRSSVPFERIFETFGTRLKPGSRQVSFFARDIISGGSPGELDGENALSDGVAQRYREPVNTPIHG